jgi:hypothetical protein
MPASASDFCHRGSTTQGESDPGRYFGLRKSEFPCLLVIIKEFTNGLKAEQQRDAMQARQTTGAAVNTQSAAPQANPREIAATSVVKPALTPVVSVAGEADDAPVATDDCQRREKLAKKL